jgi:hypothetical protein
MTAASKEHQQPCDEDEETMPQGSSYSFSAGVKLVVAAGFLMSAIATLSANSIASTSKSTVELEDETPRRRLQGMDGVPSYMNELMNDLKARKKLFEETPPEEVKYWFEYTGPLQVRHGGAYRVFR